MRLIQHKLALGLARQARLPFARPAAPAAIGITTQQNTPRCRPVLTRATSTTNSVTTEAPPAQVGRSMNVSDVTSRKSFQGSFLTDTATPKDVPDCAELDAQYFRMDASVSRWCNPEQPYTNQGGDARDILQRLTTSAASGDPQAALFWAYHSTRFMYFVTQAVSGLLAHAVLEQTTADRRDSSSGESMLPAERIWRNATPELTSRMWEAYGTWEQDYANIEAGLYKLPWDMITVNKQFNPLYLASRSLAFMWEGANTLKRRREEKPDHVWLKGSAYPQYYKTFHYQSDGWLSDWSANVYEHSTEVLFQGRQDAMQRTALIPITQYVRSSVQPYTEMKLLEVAAGTGRFHTFIKDNWPEMRTVCSDLSPFYLKRARENIKEWKRLRQPNKWLGGVDDAGVDYYQMAAEAIDAPDNSFDIVVSVYLFHELPEPVRRKAVQEFYRVLKPGGLCVLCDGYQYGDRPEYKDMAYRFSQFNEPFWVNFVTCDFGAMFTEAGFIPGTKYLNSATKTLSFTKPL